MALKSVELEPEFIQELLPAAEKTALLYHLSYLCLAGFPNPERIIRSRAVETQLLFGSSESSILKCILTSNNLVTELFPKLLLAINKNKPKLAIRLFGSARSWITEIIDKVNNILKGYDVLIKDVTSSTSDIMKEKADIEEKLLRPNEELAVKEAKMAILKINLGATTQEEKDMEALTEKKMQEIMDYIISISQSSKGLGIFAAIVPFIAPIIKNIIETVKDPEHTAFIMARVINILNNGKASVRQKEWQLLFQITACQRKLARLTIERKSIPHPVHLSEAQKSLSQIQAVFIRLKNFWEDIAQMLEALQKMIINGEEFITDIADFKEEFMKAISVAAEAWKAFAASCKTASSVLHLLTTDAFEFLEISPTDLSETEWLAEYDRVMEQLKKFHLQESLPSPDQPAIEGPKGTEKIQL